MKTYIKIEKNYYPIGYAGGPNASTPYGDIDIYSDGPNFGTAVNISGLEINQSGRVFAPVFGIESFVPSGDPLDFVDDGPSKIICWAQIGVVGSLLNGFLISSPISHIVPLTRDQVRDEAIQEHKNAKNL